ncbi:hypothetical protein D3C73_951060 [compost metagenome]
MLNSLEISAAKVKKPMLQSSSYLWLHPLKLWQRFGKSLPRICLSYRFDKSLNSFKSSLKL